MSKTIHMKKICSIVCLLFITTICNTTIAQTQEEMQKWMEYMTPSDVHKMLARQDGEWSETITMWMDPKAPEQKMETSGVSKMILGGRYQESKHTGNMMGQPFEGISVLGWDNAKKIFINSWIDNFGTGMLYGRALGRKNKNHEPERKNG